MKHLGDVTKISGYEIEPVDVLTGGSPCQDLSVAGLRKGLKHEELDDEETTRSGLFMEQIRIAKEMRERDRLFGRTGVDVRCRYFVWENVCGAYSSNGGRDFQTVLTEIIRVADPEAPDIPLPEGGWPKYGCYYSEMGDWSLAYRTVDAQFFGTPQRRKRIALLCDFNGLTAPEILFDPQLRGETENGESDETFASAGSERGQKIPAVEASLPGNPEKSREAGKGTPGGIESDVGEAGERKVMAVDCRNFTENPEINGTLQAKKEGTSLNYNYVIRVTGEHKPRNFAAGFSFGQSAQARSLGYQEEVAPTLMGGTGGNQKPVVLEYHETKENNDANKPRTRVYDARGNGSGAISPTLTGDHQNRVTDYTAIVVEAPEKTERDN